ncbi:MAG TPA: beta-ketoacyl-[acyl-carrier-protein] synthase family protein [Thermoanaerobaculia bacterium]|jgi:3-oxoacyl-[acyl-carrier-protein] synthase II|nr:beta-ketoacyl-[acyl-carrier-protein] synthase family protein [Thermoanaerobaculia bacterium]
MRRRVAVTGLGVVSSIGQSVEELWRACLAGESRVETIPESWLAYADFASRLWSPLPEPDWDAWGLGRIERLQNDRTALLAMVAAFQALEAAGIPRELRDEKRNTFGLEGFAPERTGVSLGTGIGGISSALRSTLHQALSRPKESLRGLRGRLGIVGAAEPGALELLDTTEKRLLAPARANPFAVAMTMPNTATSALSIKLSILGPQRTHCAACASGTVAIGHGYRSIAAGETDLVLAGGVEYLDDDYGAIFHSFDLARTLVRGEEAQRANRPFDRARSGFLFSQGGGAVLVLEELEQAQGRGAPVLAEVAGFAETSDAYNLMVMEPEGRQIARAIAGALADAGLRPEEIDYVNAHGTGTLANDETEAAVLARTFGSRPLVNSTKSLLGHTLGASGALEAVVTVLSLQHQTTHACRNLEEPIADLNFVRRVESHPIQNALSQSFAFGGHNAALVFQRVPQGGPP